MKIALVFPPNYEYPTATPPLGISYLKSYIQAKFSESVVVDCIDLNIVATNRLISEEKVLKYLAKLSNSVLRNINKKKLSALREIPNKNINKVYNLIKNKKAFDDDFVYMSGIKASSEYLTTASKLIFNAAENLIQQNICKNEDLNLFSKIIGLNKFGIEKYELVGISALYTNQIILGLLIANIIKNNSKNILAVIGGAAITQMPEENYKSILFSNSPIDVVCDGEGELTLYELLNQMQSGKLFPNKIPNIRFLCEGKIIKTKSVFINKLNEIPFPDFSDYDFEKYHSPVPVVPMVTSRGCCWSKCRFCDYNCNYSSKYRVRSSVNVIEEIKSLFSKYSVDGTLHISFDDSDISAVRAEKIAQKIIKEKIRVRYFFLSRPTYLHTKKRLQKIKESGCILICYGVESFNQKILDLENKGTNVDDIKKVLKNTNFAGLYFYCLYFVGFPGQTYSDLKIEFEEIIDLHGMIDSLAKTNFVLLRNTAATRMDKYIVENYREYDPLFFYHGNPLYSRAIPFVMKKGINSNDAELSMEMIHDMFLSLKGREQCKLRPEYHEIIKREKCTNKEQRRYIANFTSKYQKNYMVKAKDEKIFEKENILDKIFTDDEFLKSYIAATVISKSKLTLF